MREWSKDNLVFISEQSAPNDFKSVWKHDTRINISSQVTKQCEQLFIHEKFLL